MARRREKNICKVLTGYFHLAFHFSLLHFSHFILTSLIKPIPLSIMSSYFFCPPLITASHTSWSHFVFQSSKCLISMLTFVLYMVRAPPCPQHAVSSLTTHFHSTTWCAFLVLCTENLFMYMYMYHNITCKLL